MKALHRASETTQRNSAQTRTPPEIAILLGTHQGQHFLESQLDSIQSQSHADWSVYASDDHSTDGTLEVLSAYREKWGDEGYAREELVAELGAAFLAADLGLAIEPRPDHASYIASWIKVLQNDTRAIVQAAAHAERASRANEYAYAGTGILIVLCLLVLFGLRGKHA